MTPTLLLPLQIPVLCNDVRGPLFSFTRFERHCGSKAKKWRLSLRIEPGAVKECTPGG